MFRKFNGEKVKDIAEYVKRYVTDNENIEVIVATDSQNSKYRTGFCTVIAMYDSGNDGHGHGAHCIYDSWTTPKYSKERRQERLLKEVEESIDTAKTLRSGGVDISYVDIDISPKKNAASSDVFQAAYGWVTGEGFVCRYKTLGPLATTLADYIVKHYCYGRRGKIQKTVE